MAYALPIIRFRPSGNEILHGGITSEDASGRFSLLQRPNEVQKIVVDCTDILNGSTLTAAVTASNVTAASTVSGGKVTLTLSAFSGGRADLDLSLFFSDGRVRVEKMHLREPLGAPREDYGWFWS